MTTVKPEEEKTLKKDQEKPKEEKIKKSFFEKLADLQAKNITVLRNGSVKYKRKNKNG